MSKIPAIELEILMKDSTRQGMESVTGGMNNMQKQIEQQSALIRKLESDLKSAQDAFARAGRAGADQKQNIDMIQVLRKEVANLKKELTDLAEQQKKTSSTPIAAPAAGLPKLDLKQQMVEVKENIKYMEKYIKDYEATISKMAPGKEKALMTLEITKAKEALQAEKQALADLQLQSDSAGGSQNSLKTQILALKKEMAGMVEGTRQYADAMKRLGDLQARQAELNKQGQVFGDYNRNTKAAMDAVSGLSGAMTAGVGAASLFGMQQDKLAKIQTRLQSVMAITMGIQQVSNALNKDSYFTHIILTKAKTMLSAATLRLATSLGISTVAAQVLMGTLTLGLSVAITAIIVGLSKLSSASSKAAEEQKKFNEAAASGAAKQLAEFEKLRREWVAAGNDLKKKEELVRKSTDAFNQLGVEVNNVADAENVLIKNAPEFVRSIQAKAMAAAAMELAMEKHKEAMTKALKAKEMPDKIDPRIVPGGGESWYEGAKTKLIKEAEKNGKEAAEYAAMSLGYDEESRNIILATGMKAKDTITEGTEDYWIDIKKKQQEAMRKATPDSKEFKEAKAKRDAAIKELARWDDKPTTDKNYYDKYNLALDVEKSTQAMKDAIAKGELDIQQETIALKQEGSEKVLAQIRLDYDKRYQAIQKEEKELLQKLQEQERNEWEKANPDYKKKGLQFTPTVTGLTPELQAQMVERYNLAHKAMEKAVGDHTKELIEKYQSYADERLSIEDKHNKDIAALREARAKAQEKGDAVEVEKLSRSMAQATKDKGEALMRLDFEQLKKTPEYVRAFENLKHTSSETLTSLLSQLEAAKQTAAQVLSPDQLREYTTTIQEIMDELTARNPFGALADRKKELAEAEKELAKAKRDLGNVQAGRQVIKGTTLNPDTKKIETSYLKATEAMQKYNKAQDNVIKKTAQVQEAEKTLTESFGKLFASIEQVGNSMPGLMGEIVSMIGNIGSAVMSAIQGIQNVSATASAAIQAMEKASVILVVIGALFQLFQTVTQMMWSDDKEGYQKAKDIYENYIQILDRVIDKQKELIGTMTGDDAKKSAEFALKKIIEERDVTLKQLRDHIDSKSTRVVRWNVYRFMSDDAWKQAEKALGANKGDALYNAIHGYNTKGSPIPDTMKWIKELSIEQLLSLRDNAELFMASLDEDSRNYINKIAETYEKEETLRKASQERWTNISFDSVADNFFDTLMDMDASSEDFAKNFEKYMQSAILNSLVLENYRDRLKGWYESFDEAAKSDEDLTKGEYDKLQEEYNKIVNDALNERNDLMKAMGWTGDSAKDSQSGRAGAFTTMTQDQGTKLEGLFTSLQDHASSMDDTLMNVSNMMSIASDALAKIVHNTSYCKHLEAMDDNIAALRRDGIKTK